MKTEKNILEKNKAKDIVLSLIDAINKEDFKTARSFVTNDMKFNGVLGSRDGAEAYFKDMEKMKLKYDIQKTFVDENDVCVFYELEMGGKNVFCCAWYQVRDEQVSSLKVIFDPRPVLEASEKN